MPPAIRTMTPAPPDVADLVHRYLVTRSTAQLALNRASEAQYVAARALADRGPVEVDLWRYRGERDASGRWVVVAEALDEFPADPEDDRPPIAGHAAVAVEEDDMMGGEAD